MIPLPFPLPPLWVATLVGGLLAGGYGVHTWHKAQRVDTIERARTTEQGFQRQANQADIRYIDRLHDQASRAERNATAWQEALRATNYELAQCRVGGALIGVLNDAGMPRAAGDPAEPGPRAPAAPAPRDSDAATELGVCRRNYAEVCVPNAIQLEQLQDFTRRLIRDYNRSIGR